MFRNPSNSINPNTNTNTLGGASTLSKIYNAFTWSKLIYLVIAIIIIIVTYYLYKSWTSGPVYNANRESGSKNDTSYNKQAELMLFYVDWCPHCKTAKPEWDNLKTTYENKTINGYTIIFTEYNCTNESSEVEELMNKYKIEGYPTIKLLKDGQIIEYDAKPTKSTMEQFLNTVL
jgi:thiol-disulfide isomerase/thioredoxin